VNRIAVRRLLEAIFDFRQAQIDTLLAATGRSAIPEGRQSYNG
jgi:hypothetical protein